MKIQVLSPANSFQPVPSQKVSDFINGSAVKDGITLQITPSDSHDLRISNAAIDDNGIACFDDRAKIASMQVSAYIERSTCSNLGLTHFGINEQKRVA